MRIGKKRFAELKDIDHLHVRVTGGHLRERRVVGKAEWMEKGANPRFVVTSLPPERMDARAVYEDFYCARGNMENRIKEQQLDMFAVVRDRVMSAVRAGKTSAEVVASKPTADFDAGRLGGAITPDRFVALVYTDLSRKR